MKNIRNSLLGVIGALLLFGLNPSAQAGQWSETGSGGNVAWSCYIHIQHPTLSSYNLTGCEAWSPSSSLYHLATWITYERDFDYCSGDPGGYAYDPWGKFLPSPYSGTRLVQSWNQVKALNWTMTKLYLYGEWAFTSDMLPLYSATRGPFSEPYNGC